MENRLNNIQTSMLELLQTAKASQKTSDIKAFHTACYTFLEEKAQALAKKNAADNAEAQVEAIFNKISAIDLAKYPVRGEKTLKKYLNAIVTNYFNCGLVRKLETAIATQSEAAKAAFFNALFEQLFSKVQLVVASYYPNESEDIAADIFAKIVRKDISMFPVISDFHLERYMLKVAVNHCNTQYRLRKNKPTALDISEIGEGQFSKNHTEKLDLIMDLEQIMTYLPQQQQLAVRYWSEGYSYKEIAQMLDNTVAGVRNIIWRAKSNLIELFKNENQLATQTTALRRA